MVNYDESLKVLTTEPSVKNIQTVTTEFLSEKHDLKTQVQYINAYIQHILPVYSSLKSPLQADIRKIFYSCIGISNITNQYKLSKNEIYLKVMKDLLLDSNLLKNIIESSNNNKMELSQIKSLFFGSKIFNSFEGKFNLDKYLQLLVKQLIGCKVFDVEYIIAFLSIHPIDSKLILFQEFLNDKNFKLLESCVNKMNNLQKRQFFTKNLFPYIESIINVKNIDAIIRIFYHLNFESIEEPVVNYLSEIDNIDLQQAITYHFKCYINDFIMLLQLWGNDQYIKDVPITFQEYLTRELIIISNYLSKDELKKISTSRDFLNSITSRLSINDVKKRDLGIIIAKMVTSNEIKIHAEDEITIGKISKIDLSTPIDFTDLTLVSGMKNLSISNKKETVIHDSDDETDDEGYGSLDEAEPVFLKDLIVKLNNDKSRSLTKVLSHTIKLVRQKAVFKLEIEFYSKELITVLIGLVNKLNEDKFEELKLNAVVSIIVVCPSIISHVMKLLFTGDYSLQQRMVILSSISLSARELRGIDDEYIEKPQSNFPTNEIDSRKKLVEEVTKPRFEEIKDDDEKIIGQGTITRMSSKLTKPKEANKPNNFSKIAHKFFYPLANGWAEGINIGHYNEMFLKHYLQTMQLILSAAYPCYEFENMAEVFTEIKENTSNITI